MRLLRQIATFTVITATASPAFCGGLFAPISLDSATTMPKGVRSFRLSGFSTEVFDKYDGYGSQVPLANKFSKGVSWRELIDARPTAFERGQLKGGLQAEDIDLGEIAGDSRGLVNSRITSTIPVIAYGLTDKITVGAGLPIVRSSLNVSTGWGISTLGQQRIDELMRKGYEPKIMSVKSALQNVVATKIANYGYRPLVNEEHTDIGDLTVAGKWQFYSGDDLKIALSPKVVLPTGRTQDVDKVVDVAPGDGQVDAGLAVVGDYTLNSRWSATASAGYTYQFASTRPKRIPRSGEELISPDVDGQTHEKLGDLWGTTTALHYRINEFLFATTAYSLQYKDMDSYSGGLYDANHYNFLEADTWQFSQAAQLALTATTVPLFRAGAFAAPLDATLSYARVFDGRNTGIIDLAVLELAAYF